MLWHQLTDEHQLTDIINDSNQQPGISRAVVIFKHSIRCSISSMALSRLENKWKDDENIMMYFLDLINHRNVSNQIANTFNVGHASPQVLVIKNGKCVYNASHTNIVAADLRNAATK